MWFSHELMLRNEVVSEMANELGDRRMVWKAN